MKTAHDIKRGQAVTRWVEGVGRNAARDQSVYPGKEPTDAEYVAEHVELQYAEIALSHETAAGIAEELARLLSRATDGRTVADIIDGARAAAAERLAAAQD